MRLSGREHDKAFTCSPVNLEFGLKSRPFFVVPNNGCTTKPRPFVVEGIWFGWLDWQTNTQATCLFLFINESHKFVQDHESTFSAEENDIFPAYLRVGTNYVMTNSLHGFYNNTNNQFPRPSLSGTRQKWWPKTDTLLVGLLWNMGFSNHLTNWLGLMYHSCLASRSYSIHT